MIGHKDVVFGEISIAKSEKYGILIRIGLKE